MAICWSSVSYSQSNDSIATEIFLNRELFKKISIDSNFINSIEYTPDGFILLSSRNQFYLLGIGGIDSVFNGWNSKTNIGSFTITADSILVVVSGNTLYQAYSDPPFIKVTDIPDSDMGITSKYKDIYVFDRTLKSNKKDYSIYQISEKGIIPIVTTSTPILSVFELPSVLIFSIENMLFCVDIKTKNVYQMLALPQEDNIISIVSDTINHAFYFSTHNAIYRIKENKIEMVSEDLGGILKYDVEGLLIFSPEKQIIIRLRNNLLYPLTDNIGILIDKK